MRCALLYLVLSILSNTIVRVDRASHGRHGSRPGATEVDALSLPNSTISEVDLIRDPL